MLLHSFDQTPIYYLGRPLEEGPLPAFFYFSLSGEESLILQPYAYVPQALKDLPLRIFSFTLPGHGGQFNKLDAMSYWAEQMQQGNALIEPFLEKTAKAIDGLIAAGSIDPSLMVIGGLSRGAFVAAHLAAREKRFKALIGFAPLLSLLDLEEFKGCENPEFLSQIQGLDLHASIEELFHLHAIRFYIGNRDERVHTDVCYHFMRSFVEIAYKKRIRNSKIELFITHSIGYKGHGTSSEAFQDGVEWIKKQLLNPTA